MPFPARTSLAVALLIAAPAGAQTASPAIPAATTATYGDWTLRCETAGTGGPPSAFCEVAQTLNQEGKAAPVAQVAFGRPEGEARLHCIVALPVNVSFPSDVGVGTGDGDAHPLALVWRRCLPGACFADAVVGDDVLGRWRTAAAAGRIGYLDAAGRRVALPLSFRGLAAALDALGKR